jgi:crotonobetainyl-CoA:carnitine CoA-transferase CaiB-like acyl-CoA transferase
VAGVLDGIRVFDLTLAAVGPWASKLLGQLGADVIHVEGPKPELAHNIPPYVRGTGVLYLAANGGKRHVMLDLKRAEDRAVAFRLVERCDVFVQNMRPGAVDRLGLGYEAVSAANPGIVYVSASAYGRVGPMATEAGVDPLVQAFCGWCSVNGAPGSSGEMFRHYAHLDLTTSSMGVEAVLAALLARERTGRGQHVDLPMLAAALSLQTSRLAEFFATGVQPAPMGSASPTTVPHQAFCAQDGRWLAVGVVADDQWPRFCRALALDDLTVDPRLATNPGRVAHRDLVVASVAERIATRPLAWWALQLGRERVPHSRLLDFDDLRHHPQVVANDQLVELDTAEYGPIVVEGSPWRFSGTPGKAPSSTGRAGQHTAEVLAELDQPRARGNAAPVAGGGPAPADRPPLDGITVVDLSQGLAGPFAASRLADLGARVIKVEPPGGDAARGHGPPFVDEEDDDDDDGGGATGRSAVFAAVNRGKRSLAMDVERPEGRTLLHRLLAGADVVIEDLGRAGAAALGLTESELAASHPKLVHVAISGWGESGPLVDLPGAELPVQAMAEYLSSLGRIGEPPVRLGTDVAGLNTGIFATQAALAALHARNRTGVGQRVAVSLLGSLVHLRGVMWTSRSNPDDWWGLHLDHYTKPPELGYRTADGQVFFGLRRGNSEDFDQLLITLGLVDHLDNPHFGDMGRAAAPLGRYATEAKPVWEQGFAELTSAEVIELLQERGGDAVPFTDYAQIVAHPQTAAIDALCEVGGQPAVAPVWRFSATPAVVGGPAPGLGEHTDEVLAEFGLSPAELSELRAQAVIA